MIRGHEFARKALERELPPTLLLKGPPHVGKTTLAHHLIRHHKILKVDTLVINQLSADQARNMIEHLSHHPMGRKRAVVATLDKASPEALNAVLKLIEEPPSYAVIILILSTSTLLTIESRCHVYRLGLLPDADVRDILMAKKNFSQTDAEAAARASGGRIDRALEFASLQSHKAIVLTALKAVADGNEDLLSHAITSKEGATRSWGREEQHLLTQWAVEHRTGQYRLWSPAEGLGLQSKRKVLDRIISVSHLDLRPRLAARHALLPLITSSK